jgi:hypothetical protein
MTDPAQSQRPTDRYIQARLDLFAIRCRDLRDQIIAGRLRFSDGVDIAQNASVWSGLSDDVGDDRCQEIMALAFGAIDMDSRR